MFHLGAVRSVRPKVSTISKFNVALATFFRQMEMLSYLI